jgi:hypothetical protein
LVIKPADPSLPETPAPLRVSDAFKFRWDVLLLFAFVASTAPNATGVALHEWVGLGLIVILVVHLVLNWNWIVGTTRRVFSRLPGEMRFNHLLDSLLFVAMTLTMVSGVLSSESALATMGIAIKSDHFWGNVHGAFAYATIGMVGVHLGMHVRWIVAKLKRTRREAASGAEERS